MHTGRRNGIERVEDVVDYEWLFTHFFDNAVKDESGHLLQGFLEDDKLPFKFCKRALDAMGSRMQYYNKVEIITRPECPKELFIDICKEELASSNVTARRLFVSCLCRHCRFGIEIPREVLDMIVDDDAYLEVGYYILLPDDLKRRIMRKIGLLGVEDMGTPSILSSRFGELCDKIDEIWNFVIHQYSVPEDCMRSLDCMLDFFHGKSTEEVEGMCPKWGKHMMMLGQILESIRKLRTPLTDDDIDAMFAGHMDDDILLWNMALKCAANPSISDYGIMQLLVKVNLPDHVQKVIERIIDENKTRREEYRRTHEES